MRVDGVHVNPDAVNKKKGVKMVETEITFHNKTDTKVQAQIYVGRTLISTTLVDPGKTHALPAVPSRFDIFFKNSATGWGIARKLGTDANNFTLSLHNNRYTINVANDIEQLDSAKKSELAVKDSTK